MIRLLCIVLALLHGALFGLSLPTFPRIMILLNSPSPDPQYGLITIELIDRDEDHGKLAVKERPAGRHIVRGIKDACAQSLSSVVASLGKVVRFRDPSWLLFAV